MPVANGKNKAMKKIGIITFSRANNYGAVLQAYALKHKLKQLGADASLLNYACPPIDNVYALSPFKRSRRLADLPMNSLRIPLVWRTRRKFGPFRKKFLQDTPLLNAATIGQIESRFDAFIAGSDQVFNLRLTEGDGNYFLQFVSDKSKKFSYAASFGISVPTTQESKLLKEFLASFQEISCREQTGCAIVEKLTDKKALMHLDPTLLLNASQWAKIACLPAKKEYILAYLIMPTPSALSFIKRLAKKENLPVVVLTSSPIKRVEASYVCPTPQQWLGYFLQAKYVVTNSFHGLAFAVNFNKSFFVDLLPPPVGTNSRMENLLHLIHLQDRLVSTIQDDFQKPICWANVNAILEGYKKEAENYLMRILQA